MKVESMIRELVSQGYVVTKSRPVLNMPEKAFNFFYSYTGADKEHMLLCTLDNSLAVINTHVLHVGTVNSAPIDPREIFIKALNDKAVQIIICHNHPSGDLSPSTEDVEATRRIIEAGKVLNIPLLDHIIISSNENCKGYKSLRELNLPSLWEK